MDDPLLERLRRALSPEFEVDRRLAAGGMGIVYRGREVALDRLVAIKVLRPELATAVARERFLREARLLARLQHPNIVPVHRADERDGLPFYVMDLIEGRTLAEQLATGPLRPEELSGLAHDLLRALAASHSAGIVHRDVKPHNIFLVEGRALLGDFGISLDATSEDLALTEAGSLVGTREYMAPEQLRGESAGERSDQYSVAAVLYEAATGRQWKALDTPAKANWRGVPEPLTRVLKRALAVNPAERWPTMRGMQLALVAASHRRRRQLVAAGAVIAVALLAKVGWSAVFPPAPPADHRNLAILPFTTEGMEDDSLGVKMAAITYVNLLGYPSVTLVTPNRPESWREEHPNDDEAAARRALDVDRVISGIIERSGEGLQLRLLLTDSTGSRQLRTLQFAGTDAEPRALVDSAAFIIATSLGRRPGTDIRNLAPHNWDAVRLFVQGEEFFDKDAWHYAAERYEQAIAADSTFALARWRLLVAKLWARDYSWEVADSLAACCADQLPTMEAGLVRAMGDTNLPRRFKAFDSLKTHLSGAGSLTLMLASDFFHRGPLLGRGLPTSLAMFEDAIKASPGGTPVEAYDHLVWGKARLGEREAAGMWLRARIALGTHVDGEPPIPDFLQLAYDLRWVHWRARLKLWLFERFESDATIAQLAQFFRFSAAFDLPEGQDAVGKVIASRLLTKDRASGLEAQALAQFTWGRVPQGLALIDSAAVLFNEPEAELQRHQWRLLLPVLGAGRASEEEEAAARSWLETHADREPFMARAQWTLALDAMQRGDTVSASRWTGALATTGASDAAAARLAQLASARRGGEQDPRHSLAATETLLDFDSPAPGQDIFSRSVLHLSRAQWYEATGDVAGAEREILWYENSDAYRFLVLEAQKMEVDAVASVPARVTRARLLLDAGQAEPACRMLTRVQQLWRNADGSVETATARADSLYRAGCR